MPMPIKQDATVRPTDIETTMRWLEEEYGVRIEYRTGLNRKKDVPGFIIEVMAFEPGESVHSFPYQHAYTHWPSCDHKTVLGAVLRGLYNLENLLSAAKQLREALETSSH